MLVLHRLSPGEQLAPADLPIDRSLFDPDHLAVTTYGANQDEVASVIVNKADAALRRQDTRWLAARKLKFFPDRGRKARRLVIRYPKNRLYPKAPGHGLDCERLPVGVPCGNNLQTRCKSQRTFKRTGVRLSPYHYSLESDHHPSNIALVIRTSRNFSRTSRSIAKTPCSTVAECSCVSQSEPGPVATCDPDHARIPRATRNATTSSCI